MNQQEYHFEGVRAWQNADKNLKLFAECCYNVHNKQALASDCGCDIRTVQYYAAAWSLYQEFIREYGETVSFLWERGQIQLWRKAPELRKNLDLSLEQTREYLSEAITENMTRESFSAHVDEKENHTPKWIRRLQSAIKHLKPSKDDWKTDMPFELRQKYDRAVSRFVAELEEIAQAQEVR